MRVWTLLRSDDEIAANTSRELTGFEPGLALYYKFNESSATNVINSLGAMAFNLSLINAPDRVAAGWMGPHALYTPPGGFTGAAVFNYTVANSNALTLTGSSALTPMASSKFCLTAARRWRSMTPSLLIVTPRSLCLCWRMTSHT